MTHVNAPTLASNSMKCLAPGCWNLKTLVTTTATNIPTNINRFSAVLNFFSFFIFSIQFIVNTFRKFFLAEKGREILDRS